MAFRFNFSQLRQGLNRSKPLQPLARRFTSSAPTTADVVIAGGGIVGSSVAYFLKSHCPEASFNVVVVERDPAYTSASTVLSVGGIRHQFSVPSNVELSLYSSQFINDLPEEEKSSLQFFEEGYLVLAGSQDGAQTLKENHEVQTALGARNVLLEPDELHTRFPWLQTEDLVLSSLGISGEGWLDPWSLLKLMREKAKALGVSFVKASVTGLDLSGNRVTDVKCSEPELRISCGTFVNACGAWSSQLHAMYDSNTLPVVPRKRTVFVFSLTAEWAKKLGESDVIPLTVDPSGLYFRRDGRPGSRTMLCGVSPPEDQDKDYPFISSQEEFEELKHDIDYSLFEETMWPILAKRSAAFEQIKLQGAWSGLYDYNTLDQNGIVSKHTALDNVFIATGFSGHGLQQGPAVGRALSELILAGRFETVDLTGLSLDRVLTQTKVLEKNIY